jgi:hypothetical protein
MVRNKKRVVPVLADVSPTAMDSPTKRGSFVAFAEAAGAIGKSASSEPSSEPITAEKPPKPQLELDLINPPRNYTLARSLVLLLGDSYLAGEIRRNPDGTAAKPRLVIMPKASQHPTWQLVLGQLTALVLMLWTVVGLRYEVAGDERLLSLLGNPAAYFDGVAQPYSAAAATPEQLAGEGNFSGLYVTGWANTTYSGPLVYRNFTCLQPVRCDTDENRALPECAGVAATASAASPAAAVDEEKGDAPVAAVADAPLVFVSSQALARGGVLFGNQTDPNAPEYRFPWYPLYFVIHEGYNWARVQRPAAETKGADNLTIAVASWTPSAADMRADAAVAECPQVDQHGSPGLLSYLEEFLGNRSLNDFLGIPE